MSHQIFVSALLIELLDQQQQLVADGADFELTDSNQVLSIKAIF